MTDLPEGPWSIQDSTHERPASGYLGIRGPRGEKICDIFPFAGHGGIGADAARAVAELIVSARKGRP